MPRYRSATAAMETPSDDLDRSASWGFAVNDAITQPMRETAMPIPETITSRPAALLASWPGPASTLGGRPCRSGWTLMSFAKARITNDLLCRGCGEPELKEQGFGGAGTERWRGRLPRPASGSEEPGPSA